ncbi:unnamed protein product [Ectocarpus sp. 12 AP-2014]
MGLNISYHPTRYSAPSTLRYVPTCCITVTHAHVTYRQAESQERIHPLNKPPTYLFGHAPPPRLHQDTYSSHTRTRAEEKQKRQKLVQPGAEIWFADFLCHMQSRVSCSTHVAHGVPTPHYTLKYVHFGTK